MEKYIIVVDLVIAVIWLIMGLVFLCSKGGALNLHFSYHFYPEKTKAKFDKSAMCKAYGKIYLLMFGSFVLGTLIDLKKRPFGFLLAWVLWGVLFGLLTYRRIKMENVDHIKDSESDPKQEKAE